MITSKNIHPHEPSHYKIRLSLKKPPPALLTPLMRVAGQGLGIAGCALINSGAPPKLEASLAFAGFTSKYGMLLKLHLSVGLGT